MWVEDQFDFILLEQIAGQLVGPREEGLPLDVGGLGQRAAVHVRVLLRQVHQVLGADLAQQPRNG
jgi:hypothetical protein